MELRFKIRATTLYNKRDLYSLQLIMYQREGRYPSNAGYYKSKKKQPEL